MTAAVFEVRPGESHAQCHIDRSESWYYPHWLVRLTALKTPLFLCLLLQALPYQKEPLRCFFLLLNFFYLFWPYGIRVNNHRQLFPAPSSSITLPWPRRERLMPV